MSTRYQILALLLLMPCYLLAQTGHITGSLYDERQQPIPFANVVLLTAPDSVLNGSTTTDLHGAFSFNSLPLRTYILRISTIDYETYKQLVPLTTEQPSKSMGSLVLKPSSHSLKEVNVTGHQLLMQVEGDKLVMNVAASATQAGLNGLEVLAKVPGVTVDRNTEQVSLRNQSPLVMIDGRPTHLSADQLTQLLKTMRSDDISTIEVVQNPSARYEAAGTAGILNIRTKKAQRYGNLYTVQVGGAYGYFKGLGSTPQHQESFTFSRRGGLASVYASLSNVNNYTISEQSRDQKLLENGQLTELRQNVDRSRGRLSTRRLTINAEWYPTPRTTVSVQAQHLWSTNLLTLHGTQFSQRTGSSSELNTDYERFTDQRYLTLSTQLVHQFDTLGRQLTVALDGASLRNELNTNFAYRIYLSDNPGQVTQTTNQLNSPFTNPIYTAKADYVHPTRRGQRWELGTQVTRTDNRNTFASDFVGGQLRQEYFRFLEVISAGYVQWSGGWYGYKIQAGLRAEQTQASGYNEQDLRTVERSYLNICPSASIGHQLGKRQLLTLAYSRRLDRPNYYQYSPFQRFTSRYEYTQGNALLTPFLTHSMSLRHVWKDAVVTTLSYDRATRVYSSYYTLDQTTIPGQTLIRTSFINTEPKQVAWYNLNGSAPLDPTRWLHLDLSYWYNYRVYQNLVNGEAVDSHVPSFGGVVTASFNLPKAIVLEITADAYSGEAMGAFERSRPAGQVDLGIRKTFMQKRATFKLNLSDPFDLNRYRVQYDAPELQAYNQTRSTNRLLRLQFTYNMGNTSARTSSRTTGVQENTNRSNSGL